MRGHPEREGEHVGGAAGEDRRAGVAAEEPDRDLAQGAVAAETEHDLAAAGAAGLRASAVA